MLNIDEHQLMHLARQHQNRGELQPAAHICRQIIAAAPQHSQAWHLLGVVTLQEGKYADAIPMLQRAIALQPSHQDFHINLGIALAKLDRNEEAVGHYKTALALAPDYDAAYYNLGCSLFALKRLDEAADAYRHTLRLNPAHVGSRVNLGNILAGIGETPHAEQLLREALAIRPENAAWHSNLIYALQFHPDYTGARLLAEAKAWNNRHAEPLRRHIQPHPNDRAAERRLRIGYVSPDFKDHVAGTYMMPLFRHSNRDQFEVHCFGSVMQPDRITGYFQQLAHYHDISRMSDDQAANLIRQQRIDILIDLSLHMAGNRLRIFAMKPAPVQVTYLAYPGTTGLSTMDYRISDPYLDPLDAGEEPYTETTVRLPRSFWCFELSDNRFDSMPPAVNELPAISNHYLTFGSLNNFRKINPATLELWGQVLAAVPHSRMIILAQAGSHQDRARDFLETMGVSRERIRFEPL
ncbi:MAG TPA: tetratricopeptide repeat protein, partial [Phycisphaerae bacterium]